ncbi:MAG: nucleotidyltransferase domain-containing protein [Planctomycetes bacterium]|nr:nucleotidyltransferase domain-containing protein [Planctomycetota bacterium]
MSFVVVKSVNEEAVRRAMDEYAARLFQSHPEVEEVVVFGSMAKGNYAPGSDIDVFILLSHSDESVRDRVPEFLPGSFPVPVDVFPYTRDEAARLASSPIIRAVEESRWRYSRPRT